MPKYTETNNGSVIMSLDQPFVLIQGGNNPKQTVDVEGLMRQFDILTLNMLMLRDGILNDEHMKLPFMDLMRKGAPNVEEEDLEKVWESLVVLTDAKRSFLREVCETMHWTVDENLIK